MIVERIRQVSFDFDLQLIILTLLLLLYLNFHGSA